MEGTNYLPLSSAEGDIMTEFEVHGIPAEIIPGKNKHEISITVKVKFPCDIFTRNAIYMADGPYKSARKFIKIHDSIKLNVFIDEYKITGIIKPEQTLCLESKYIEIIASVSGGFVTSHKEICVYGFHFDGTKYIRV